MNITFENPDKVNGLLTITIDQEDYQDKVEKTLKNYRKRAQVPGFRPGMVPMGMIKKQYGMAVKVEEINRLLGETLNKYITDNKIQMLGEPLASEKQEPQDLEKAGPYTFQFDIAVAPEIDVTVSADDKLTYYDITVEDKMVDDQVKNLQGRYGEMQQVQTFQGGTDTLTGDLRQLDAEGNTVDGGLTVSGGQVMPKYMKDEAQQKAFDGAKTGDIITFNPRKAYDGNDTEIAALLKMKKEEVGAIDSDFSFQVTEIRHFEPAEVNQELFDKVLGQGAVEGEEAFRAKIADDMKGQLAVNSDFKLLMDLRDYLQAKAGELTMPTELLKRVLKQANKEKSEEEIEKVFDESVKTLKWQLVRNKVVEQLGVKVNDDDLKAMAQATVRQQFAQYGMTEVPDDLVEKYATEQLKKREVVEQFIDNVIDRKLVEEVKNTVTLDHKAVTMDEFTAMLQKK